MAVAGCLRRGYNAYSCMVRGIVDAVEAAPTTNFTELSRDIVKGLMGLRVETGPIYRYMAYLRQALSAHRLMVEVNVETTTPLAVHLRNPYMPLEIGLAWHPYFNAPYIPATTIRGALRAHSPPQACGRPAAEVFGTVDEQGDLVITDALPLSEDALGADVLTPHYREPDGVEEHKVRPIPLVFPIVKPHTKFAFFAASDQLDPTCMGDILSAVEKALSRGVGAKTRVGYSRAKII